MNLKMQLWSFLLIAGLVDICVGNQTPLTEQNSSPFTEDFDKRVEWALDHYDTPGLAIAVIKGDDVFTKGYGWADVETSRPVTEHTLFLGGSTSKAVTAAAISRLVDDPKYPEVQWDVPVQSIIPEDFAMIDPWYTTHVTVRDILSHRSGLPRHDWVMFGNLTLQEVVRSIRHLPLTADIRTRFQYCNTLYATAAHLIETVTGQSLHEFAKENLWTPLNMSETYFSRVLAQEDNRDLATGYYVDPRGKLVTTPPDADLFHVRGAGGILTSVHDYAKWASAFIHGKPPISPAGYSALLGATMIAPPTLESFTTLYGLGWFLETYRGVSLVQHTGAQWGFGAMVMFLPAQQLGIVILGNNLAGANAAAPILAFDIIDDVLGTPESERINWANNTDEAIKAGKFSNATLAAVYPDLPENLLPHPLNLSAYEGEYLNPAMPGLRISSDCPARNPPTNPEKWTGARLCAEFIKSAPLPPLEIDLYHITDTFWTLVATLADGTEATQAEFRLTPEGRVSQLGIEEDEEMVAKGEKMWWDHAV